MTDTLHQLIDRLRQTGGLSESGRLADGELLLRFVRNRDEAAFEVLVWRHGGMVLASAHRLLGNDADAEDAFQATFLTLALKAGAVRNGACLAGWLHQVTCRIANRLRRTRARRRTTQPLDERELAAPEEPKPDEWAGELDAAISRLPEPYRRVVVLHYLEQRSTEQVAAMLGLVRGTVLSRLASARKMLKRRLEHRGTAVTVAAALSAAGPRAVRGDIAGIPLMFVGGADAVRPNVLSLTRGVIRTMFWHKYRIPLAAALVTAGCFVVIGVGRADKPGQSPHPNQTVAAPDDKKAPADSDAAKLQSLLRVRRENLQREYDQLSSRKDLQDLASTLEHLITVQERLLEVELELSDNPRIRMELYQRAQDRAKRTESGITERVAAGLEQPQDASRAKDLVLKVEIAMLKEKMRQERN